MPEFDPFVLFQVSSILFQVLLHRARIQSFHFVSGSLVLLLDSIPLFCFVFSSIEPGFDPYFIYFFIFFISGSPILCLDSIPSFFFGFSGIMPRFDPFLWFQVLLHRTLILLSFPALCPNFPHLPRYRV